MHAPPITQLIGRRVLQLGGLVAGTKLIPAPLPQWLHPTLHRVAGTGVFPADAPCNHVLVNEYEPDGGIMVWCWSAQEALVLVFWPHAHF